MAAAKVVHFNVTTAAAASTIDVTGFGFNPVLVLFFWGGHTGTNGQAEGNIKPGGGYALSATDRRSSTGQSEHGAAASNAHNMNRNDSCISTITTAAGVDGRMDFDSWITDGVRLVIDDAFAVNVRVTAIGFSADAVLNAQGGTSTIPTSSGARNNTTLGFQPNFLMPFTGDGWASDNTIDTWIMLSFGWAAGVGTPNNGQLLARTEGGGIADSNTARYCNNTDCFAITFDINWMRMGVTGWLSNGWSEDWRGNLGASVHDFNWLAVEFNRVSLATFLTQTNTSTPISITGHGSKPDVAIFLSSGAAEHAVPANATDQTVMSAHHLWSVGAASVDGAQGAHSTYDKDASALMDCAVAVSDDSVYIHQSNDATIVVDGEMAVTAFTDDGVDCIMLDADPSQSFGLCLMVGETPPSVALTGTAAASITEADIVAGGKTIILTVTGDTLVPAQGFPVVEAVAESSVNTAGTSHAVTLPAGIVASDLVLILMDIGSTSATLNALTDWTESLDEAVANGLKILRYTGAGVPSNPTFVSSANTRSASLAYRISNADKTIAPQIATTATGTSATPDPPSVTPTGGVSKDYLFIAFYGAAGEEADDDTWSDTSPTNYTPSPPRQKACGTAGTNLGGMIAAAERQLTTGAAQNPGTFAKDVSVAWRSQHIIIHPDTPFANARAAQRAEYNSAQSEAGGWNATVRDNIPLDNIVRTDDNTITATLQAQADYDIEAQEIITGAIAASMLTGGVRVAATPTFTIDEVSSGLAVTGSFRASGLTIFAPTIAAEPLVLAAHRPSTLAAFAPTLAYRMVGPTRASALTIFAPALRYQVVAAHRASAFQAFPPTVAPGAVTIAGAHRASTLQRFAPTVAPGAAALTSAHRASTLAPFPPTLTAGGSTILAAHRASTLQHFAPTVIAEALVLAAHRASTLTIFAPATVAELRVLAAHRASTLQTFPPLVTPGAVGITTAVRASTTVLSPPSVTAGGFSVTAAHRASTNVLFAPTLAAGAVSIIAATRPSTMVLRAPTVTPGAVAVTGAHRASTKTLFTPQIAYEVRAAHRPSTLVLSTPSIAVGSATIVGAHRASSLVTFSATVAFAWIAHAAGADDTWQVPGRVDVFEVLRADTAWQAPLRNDEFL